MFYEKLNNTIILCTRYSYIKVSDHRVNPLYQSDHQDNYEHVIDFINKYMVDIMKTFCVGICATMVVSRKEKFPFVIFLNIDKILHILCVIQVYLLAARYFTIYLHFVRTCRFLSEYLLYLTGSIYLLYYM